MGAVCCDHHGDRAAIGVCMGCRKPMCDECVTKLDGINYCHACLLQLVEKERAQPRTQAAQRRPLVSIGFTLLVLCTLVWLMLSALLMQGEA